MYLYLCAIYFKLVGLTHFLYFRLVLYLPTYSDFILFHHIYTSLQACIGTPKPFTAFIFVT